LFNFLKSRTVWSAIGVGLLNIAYDHLPAIQAAVPQKYTDLVNLGGLALTSYFRLHPRVYDPVKTDANPNPIPAPKN